MPAETDACILPNAPELCNVLITTLSKILASPFKTPEPVKLRWVHLRPDGIAAVGPPWHRPSHSNIQWLRTLRGTVPSLTSPTASEVGGWLPESGFSPTPVLRCNLQHLSVADSPPFPIVYERNTVSLSHLHLVVYLLSVFWVLHIRRPVCVALRSVTTERRTIWSVGRKQGTLPWAIQPVIPVSIRLFRYPIAGWLTPRSASAVRWLFCPLTDWVRIDAIFMCPPRPVVLGVPQTRIRLASPVSSTPSDLGGFFRWCRSVSWSYSGSRCVKKKSEYSEYCLLVVLLPSISSALNPPEFYPGHGHQM